MFQQLNRKTKEVEIKKSICKKDFDKKQQKKRVHFRNQMKKQGKQNKLIKIIRNNKDEQKEKITNPPECMICSTSYSYCLGDIRSNNKNNICEHFINNVCPNCLDQWMSQQIQDQGSLNHNLLKIKCPINNCNQLYPFNLFPSIFNMKIFPLTTSQLFNHYCRQQYDIVNCPNPSCTYRGMINSKIRCTEPYQCSLCQHQWNEQSQNSFKNLKELKSNLYKYFFTKNCPTCNAHIQKNGGCNNMTCRKCQTGFCWLCLNPHGKHPASCALKQAAKSLFLFSPVIYMYKKLQFLRLVKNYSAIKKCERWYDYFLYPFKCFAVGIRFGSYYAFSISSILLAYTAGLSFLRMASAFKILVQNTGNSYLGKPQIVQQVNISQREKKLQSTLPITTVSWIVSGLISYYFGNKTEFKIFLGVNFLYASFIFSIIVGTQL